MCVCVYKNVILMTFTYKLSGHFCNHVLGCIPTTVRPAPALVALDIRLSSLCPVDLTALGTSRQSSLSLLYLTGCPLIQGFIFVAALRRKRLKERNTA